MYPKFEGPKSSGSHVFSPISNIPKLSDRGQRGLGTFHILEGGGDSSRSGWTVLDDLPVLGVFWGAESKKRKKNWIRPPPGADLGGRGEGKNCPYYLKLIWHVGCLLKSSRSFKGTITEPRQQTNTRHNKS